MSLTRGLRWVGKRRETLLRRLVFSAKERCDCGEGLAYVRFSAHPVWDCSAILLGDALLGGEKSTVTHSPPRAFFEVVSERQPAAHGATTRPEVAPST